VVSWTRAIFLAAVLAGAATGAEARQRNADERAYYRAVARFFEIPEGEVAILGQWNLPAEEIPVVLFLARRAGVSAEALVALRRSGRSWPSLASSYGIGANVLHVPLRDPGSAGALRPLYERFGATPVARWASLQLSDAEIVALVNVRVLAQALGRPPDDVARRTGTVASFVELYAQFLR
jgi:hypothetical protein